jgi:hypothetical protein
MWRNTVSGNSAGFTRTAAEIVVAGHILQHGRNRLANVRLRHDFQLSLQVLVRHVRWG